MTAAHVLTILGPRQLAWTEHDLAAPRADELLVETIAGAISIGSELPVYQGDARSTDPLTFPRTSGYESVARVVEIGPEGSGFAPGDTVVASYGHATRALISGAKALPVPPGIPPEIAALAILTCDIAKGLRALHAPTHSPLLISGGGAIGLLTLWTARQLAFDPVDLIEPMAPRRDLARLLGARHAVDPIDAVELPDSYPFASECSSNDNGFASLQRAMATGGRICVLADGNTDPLTLAPAFHSRELTVIGSSDGVDYAGHARWFFSRSPEALMPLRRLYDLRIPASRLIETFEGLASGAIRAVKVLVDYNAG